MNNQWTTTNNNTEPWTRNIFFSDGGLTPHFFIFIFIFFWEEGLTLRCFICQSSGLEKNSWLLQCHINEQQQQHEHLFSDGGLTPHFFHIHFLSRRSYLLRFICQSSGLHQVERTSWSSPGGGRACPKITARCWEIVSVGQLLVRQFQWEMLGLTLTIFDRKIHDFYCVFPLIWWFFALGFVPSIQWTRSLLHFFYRPILWLTAAGWIVSVGDVGLKAHHFWSNNPCFLPCFSINLVVLCPWLCAINSVDPISSLDFYGPMLWLTAAGWIVSVGDVGLNTHHFWSKNPWFFTVFSINLVFFCPWLCAINSVGPISSLDFYGPMLWLTAAGWIASVGDDGLNAHHFWSKNPWFLLCFPLIWWFFALGFVPSIQWTRSLLQFFMGPCYDSQLLVG